MYKVGWDGDDLDKGFGARNPVGRKQWPGFNTRHKHRQLCNQSGRIQLQTRSNTDPFKKIDYGKERQR